MNYRSRLRQLEKSSMGAANMYHITSVEQVETLDRGALNPSSKILIITHRDTQDEIMGAVHKKLTEIARKEPHGVGFAHVHCEWHSTGFTHEDREELKKELEAEDDAD